MDLLYCLLITAAFLVSTGFLIAYLCFRMAFYANRNHKSDPKDYHLPPGPEYEPYYGKMTSWIDQMRALPHETFAITSFDGLKLQAKYYEFAPGAPIELMFHGYRSTGERDLCGGISRCRQLGRSAFIVDQRGAGDSEGNVITFGIREHKDCLAWVDFMIRHFGPDVKIILCGISMGAATVTMASGTPLPDNVIGVLADCGFTSAKDMIEKTIRELHLPPKLLYPFVKAGARIFGGFDLHENSPIEAVARCTVPIIFIHGEADTFVPSEMSRKLYDACPSRKHLLTVPGAAHGLSFPAAPDLYVKELSDFFGKEASYPSDTHN